ncbi:MAG: lipid-A-disaccharide synthase [Halothiobacillaceae bacterium]|nr:lipid-A-disaccharide synthase [Halothiobacillaceae bacterium]
MNAISDPRAPRIMIAAGEASGDMYGAILARKLRERCPQVALSGMGGPALREAQVRLDVDADGLGVVGLIEVLRHYPQLRRALRTLTQRVCTDRPDLLILIDYQEFNQRLAREARRCGVPVLFFVGPQVWAWRPRRVFKLRDKVDRMALLFPFEPPLYAGAGIEAECVGHPLVDEIPPHPDRAAARAALGLAGDAPLIGLLPGSRRSEIERLMPLMAQTARRLLSLHPQWRFALPVAPTLDRAQVQTWLDEDLRTRVHLLEGRSREVMAACDALLIASGTATLEAGLIGTPMAIVYRTQWLTYQIARHLVNITHIGLPNIVAGEGIVREFIQDAATPEALAAEMERLLGDSAYADAQRQALAGLRQKLGDGGALDRLAATALAMATPALARPGTGLNRPG